MKIAVISDIHGNLDALKSILEDIATQNAEKIFICGDLALAGAEPSETIDYILELASNLDVTIIQGNTDEMIAKATFQENDIFIPPNKIMANALKYQQQILTDIQKDFLLNLPPQKTIQIGKINILLVHGSPRRNNEDILPGKEIETIKEMIAGTIADIVFCGHTHLPAGYQIEKQTVVNVGSVGRPFTENRLPCYALLNIPDLSKKEFEISHRFVKYDSKLASEKLANQPFEGADKLAGMLIKVTTRYPE